MGPPPASGARGERRALPPRRYKELLATREDLERARDEAVEARLEAERALTVKSQFLATMSHELRTPLNGVIGMSELLMHTTLDDEQSEYATTIHGCGQTLLHLINDVLDYSKLEAHKLSITPSVFDVREVVENVLDMLGGQARAQGLELGADFRDIPRFIETDPHRLQQILLNLVGNAVKFTAEGEVFVTVEEVDHTKDATTLRFSVRDTGAGIPETFLPELFTPFTQADGSSTRAHGGTGLGLAISKELVTCLGGAIDVESTVGQGSLFRFTIRAKLAPAPADEQPLPPLGPFSVLVVDDNPTNRFILTRTLQRWGLDV
ncbi:MAG: hybrid sensor histidine kinase/response regulator, partial [Myxococcales bacterium]|nr:hybrid sensor histidine kinase/response regulator [Myxococcales bacterium]